MDFEKIVIDVLYEINCAIKSLVSKGVIVHDSEKSHWIYLEK